MDRILLAIDLSEESSTLISKAVEICRALRGRMRVLHVQSSAPYSYTPEDPEQPVLSEVSKKIDPNADEKLSRIDHRLDEAGIESEFRELRGPVENNILLAAKEFNADLIIIGGQQRGRLFQCFFGTKTDAIIRQAPCPVLVVPAGIGESKT